MKDNITTFCRGKNVVLSHGNRVVTPEPLNFELPEGKAVGLIGPNGSGKTTFLRALIGDAAFQSGDIFFNDGDQSLRNIGFASLSTMVAIVPQEHQFPKHLLLKEALRMAYLPSAGLFGKLPKVDDPRILAAIRRFRLEPLSDRPLDELSTGERQRAFLARAFLQQTRVLLLDEPTNHLDPGGRAQFWRALTESRKERIFDVIISTHDLDFVKSHCDWICALKEGKLIYCGDSEGFWKENLASQLFES